MISENSKVVGGVKYLTMVRGEPIPPVKFSMIPEHVLLLEKISTTNKFLLSCNDRRVPEEWLKRYGHQVRDVVFFFLDEQTGELERVS